MCDVVPLLNCQRQIKVLEGIILNLEKQIPVPRPKPISRRTISSADLRKIIREKFPTGDIEFSDMEFDLCDIEDIEALLDVDETNHIKYVSRTFDCDNFSRLLWGQFGTPDWGHFAIGLFWSDKHAMVLCVDANEDVWLIEPQTDVRRSDLLAYQGAEMRFVII